MLGMPATFVDIHERSGCPRCACGQARNGAGRLVRLGWHGGKGNRAHSRARRSSRSSYPKGAAARGPAGRAQKRGKGNRGAHKGRRLSFKEK